MNTPLIPTLRLTFMLAVSLSLFHTRTHIYSRPPGQIQDLVTGPHPGEIHFNFAEKGNVN